MSRPAALVDPDWHEAAVQAIGRIAKAKGSVTADDLRAEIEAPENGNKIGRAFAAAHRRNLITPIAYNRSTSRSRRGGSRHEWGPHPDVLRGEHR